MERVWIYIAILVVTGVITFALSFHVRKWAISHKLTQKIRDRDMHKKPVPRLGGLAIFIGFWIVTGIILVFGQNNLNFVNHKVLGIDKNLFGVLLGAVIIAVVMLYDDIKGLKWSWKLIAQFAAAMCVAAFDVTISWANSPFQSLINLSDVAFTIGSIGIAWGQIFIVFWIVLVMNVVNWLDGLDGLASGITLISTVAIFLLAASPRIDQPATALLAIILIGSILGFMPFNFNPAKMFLGDTGSMFIGYILAVLAVISGGKVATATLVMGIPLIDGLWVIATRLIHHKSPFEADQNHIHHRLLKAGLTVKQTVLVLYTGSMILGYLALRSGPEGKFWALIWLIGVMVFLSLGLLVLKWMRRTNI